MNAKKGLFRLWLVVSAGWLIWFFGSHVWLGCGYTEIYPPYGARTVVPACHINPFGEWVPVTDFAFRQYFSVFAWGIGVPIALMAIGLISRWVAQGFSRENSN
jgi:hypothetical protein